MSYNSFMSTNLGNKKRGRFDTYPLPYTVSFNLYDINLFLPGKSQGVPNLMKASSNIEAHISPWGNKQGHAKLLFPFLIPLVFLRDLISCCFYAIFESICSQHSTFHMVPVDLSLLKLPLHGLFNVLADLEQILLWSLLFQKRKTLVL